MKCLRLPIVMTVALLASAIFGAAAIAAHLPRKAQRSRRLAHASSPHEPERAPVIPSRRRCTSIAALPSSHRHHRSRLSCRRAARTLARRGHSARVQSGQSRRRSGNSPRVVSLPSSTGLARVGILARVLATPCQDTQLIPESANLELIRAAVLCLINKERAQNGETPLKPAPALEAAAEGHAQEMVASDYFAHVSPSGLTPVGRARGAGYLPNAQVGYVIGENIAWGTLTLATPQAIVSAWIASPEHLANILEAHYQDTGIAIAPQVPPRFAGGAPGATYAQEFGVITP